MALLLKVRGVRYLNRIDGLPHHESGEYRTAIADY